MRWLSVAIFFPPLMLAYLISKYAPLKRRAPLALAVFLLIFVLTVPDLYGANHKNFPSYLNERTVYNLHSSIMTPIWAGATETYPIKDTRVEIIEGDGEIVYYQERNASRRLSVGARTDLRLADYTFYFPGWEVRVDGQPVPIEFQDEMYRGIITYRVPMGGGEQIEIVYKETKLRLLANSISLAAGLFLIIIVITKRKELNVKDLRPSQN